MISFWGEDPANNTTKGMTIHLGPVEVDCYLDWEQRRCIDVYVGRDVVSAFMGRWFVGYAYLVGDRAGHGVIRPMRWAHSDRRVSQR